MAAAAMDPQFTHSKLLEAASLLRLPVSVLVDSLGLAPDVFSAESALGGAMPSWDPIPRHWPYADADQVTSSDGSLPGFDASLPDNQDTYPLRHLLSVSLRRGPPASPAALSPNKLPTTLASAHPTVHAIPSPKPAAPLPPPPAAAAAVAAAAAAPPPSRRASPGDGPSPRLIKAEEQHGAQRGRDTCTPPGGQSALPLGPCSKVWSLPPRIRRRKKVKPDDDRSAVKQRREPKEAASRQGPKRRGPYSDETKKRNTALTRILKSCIRCRMNRGRCNPDPEDPSGACLTCKGITGPTLCKMPCYRYIITDASLYREQRAPYQLYTQRWQSMDIVNIPDSDWASPQVRTIVVSPNHLDAPFRFRVREFIPAPGDLLEERWITPLGKASVALPRYAVAEMNEAANDMKDYIEGNMGKFIAETVGNLDTLLWETYTAAFRHIANAQTPEERSLLTNTFRLWVTCRLISNPVHICGGDLLGGSPVYSENSLHNGLVPMPVIMTAQFECINYTTFLRPWSKAVLKQLNELVLAKKRDYWLTIYYSMFVLLHSCSMMTRRDQETARQYDMPTRYANPESILAHHSGAQTMLAHFHFINKGVIPFSLPHDATGKQELAKAANLSDEQIRFVWRTARLVSEPERAARIRQARDTGDVGDDLYWISMLYDREWLPPS